MWIAHLGPEPVLRVGRVAEPAEVAGWDLAAVAAGSLSGWGEPDPGPLLLVCANGRRDRCCGHDGGRLAASLQTGPWADRVLTSTHLGGHRFAPTALLLPFGALHGRLDAGSAGEVLAHSLEGRTPTPSLRGFSTLDEPAQVAEAHARSVLGYDGLAPLEVRLEPAARPDLSAPTGPVRLRALVTAPSGAALAIDLARTSRSTLASCGRAPELMPRWTVGN